MTDFSKSHQDGFFDKLEDHFRELDLSILINNVGVWYYGPFLDMSPEQCQNHFLINCLPATLLTRKVIPYFLKRDKKLKSGIIFMSSILAGSPMKNHTLYNATKRYVDYLSRSLSEEFRGKLDILSVRPSFVTTGMIYNFHFPLLSILPEQCA